MAEKKQSKLNGESLDTVGKLKKQLYTLMPEIFTEGQESKIDWEKLKATLGEDIDFSNERYVLNWAGKSDAFKIMQEPTTRTLSPCKEESINFDESENIFIEGENLEVLKVLQKSYFGKIKMIYIDPPYNTGNDSFIYPDKFSETKEEYLKRVGDKDDEGYMTKEGRFGKNSKENGQYHSNWLNMMYPRLFLARNLLKDDGVIFVSIDDNEVHNLRLVMNEIFGEENFVGQFVWKRRSSSALSDNNVSADHEYVLCYQKGNLKDFSGINKDFKKYSNPDNDPRGPWISDNLTVGMNASMRPNQAYNLTDPKTGSEYPFNPNRVWAYIPETMNKMIDAGRIIFPKDLSRRPMLKRFKNELKSDKNPLSTLLIDQVGLNTEATRAIQGIMGGNIFEYSKPLSLLKALIPQVCQKNDIVLDFFSGSATLAHAMLELNKEDNGNRKFICVQLPEPCDIKSEAYKAGYQTIADIAKERIRRVIKKIKDEQSGKLEFSESNQDLGFKVFKLTDSNFKQWQKNPKNEAELAEQLKLMVNPINGNPTKEAMIIELILKSGFSLNSDIEEKNGVYLINQGQLAIVLDTALEKTFIDLIKLRPAKVITLDAVFNDNDQLKTNVALQFKDADIEFKTI